MDYSLLRLVVMVSIIISPNLLFSQIENIWAFGDGLGIDFNETPPIPISTSINTAEACASVCDNGGNLLFYTNGSVVWDKNDLPMPNGGQLMSIGLNVTNSTAHGTIIVPKPFNPEEYYVFSIVEAEQGEHFGKLFYSVVNMKLNGGLGDVVSAEKDILLDSLLSERIIAVEGNRCNIWLVAVDRSGMIKCYNIDQNGINLPAVISNIGLGESWSGGIAVSNSRSKIAFAQMRGLNGGYLCDFDPETGSITSPIPLLINQGAYSAAFSPDDTKLYFSGAIFNNIVQYDLSSGVSPVIQASEYSVFSGQRYTDLKKGPNGKIYFFASQNQTDIFLGSIDAPNLVGVNCSINSSAIPISNSRLPLGLPNVVPMLRIDSIYRNTLHSTLCFTAENYNMLTPFDSSGWDYVWNGGTTGTALLADTPGTYLVSYHTSPCNYNVDTFHVSFPNGVVPMIGVREACRSDSNGFAFAFTYPGDPVDYSYTWLRGTDTLSVTDSLQDVPAGSYSLYVQTDTGCDTLLLFEIPEVDFRVSFTVSDTLICLGDTIRLTNTSDLHFTTFHWAYDNGDTITSRNPAPYMYPGSGAYQLMLAGEGWLCRDTAYQTIIVDQPPLPHFEVRPREVCVGQPAYLFPRSDSTTIQLAWDMEEQLRIESRIQPRYQHGFASSGTFPVTLKVESRACPDTSVTDSIRVYPFPEVDFGSDSSICLHGQPIYLKNRRSAPLTSYHQVWSTGDTTEVLKVVHPGTYTLSVTAEPIGCTTTETIEIKKDCYIDVPNAFTPNGDGHNDYFLPRQLLTDGLIRFRIQVFNRWGQLVFESNQLDGRGWDGRFNEKPQPTGVYLYRIEVDFKNGRQENYEGNVTLLR